MVNNKENGIDIVWHRDRGGRIGGRGSEREGGRKEGREGGLKRGRE